MSTSDKILEIIKQNPAISSKAIYETLRKNDPNFRESYRTVQNYITSLNREKLIQQHAICGNIVYSAANSGISENDVFYVKVWNELFQIQSELSTNRYTNQTANFLRLRGLVLMLPSTLQQELTPTFDKVLERIKSQNSAAITLYADLDEPPTAQDEQRYNMNFMFELIGKVATALHKRLELKAEEKETTD
jgi:Fe2+ or Zn2+ uptake regulation protein